MADITERLRQYGDGLPTGLMLMRNAADEIDRLRARVAELEVSASEVFTAMLVEIDGHTYGLRPGAARIVKEAMRDAQMLDFMIKTSASIGQVCGAGHWVLHFWPTDETEKVVRAGTPKEAIDAAMAKDGA